MAFSDADSDDTISSSKETNSNENETFFTITAYDKNTNSLTRTNSEPIESRDELNSERLKKKFVLAKNSPKLNDDKKSEIRRVSILETEPIPLQETTITETKRKTGLEMRRPSIQIESKLETIAETSFQGSLKGSMNQDTNIQDTKSKDMLSKKGQIPSSSSSSGPTKPEKPLEIKRRMITDVIRNIGKRERIRLFFGFNKF